VSTGTVTTNEPVSSADAPGIESRADDALRKLAVRHIEHVRKFKLYLSAYVLSMLVLTPIWIVTQYESADGWPQHLSSRSRYPGDWDPWIIWVALIGAAVVGIAGLRAYFSRADTEGDIQREIARIKSTR
jgi:hypothetical protein